MAFSVAALLSKNEISITEANAIKKTYPNFFDDYNSLGGKAQIEIY